MSDKFTISAQSELLLYLIDNLHGWSRNKIKQRLKTKCVVVNDTPITRHDHVLNPGDIVEVKKMAKNLMGTPKLEILYTDQDLVAINKPPGLLSVGSEKEKKQHALAILREQLSRPKRQVELWPVHRIDQGTSGVLLFATSRRVRESVMDTWDYADKRYLAVVEGIPSPSHGTITQPLRKDKTKYCMHVGPHPEAKPAVTHYETRDTGASRSLLEVRLDTGRQHQIRAHLSWLKHPVVGDPRYGAVGASPRLGLHALSLSIKKPGTIKELTFEAPIPADLLALLK